MCNIRRQLIFKYIGDIYRPTEINKTISFSNLRSFLSHKYEQPKVQKICLSFNIETYYELVHPFIISQ